MADITFSGDSDFSKVQKDFDDLSRRTAKLEKENYRLKQSADNQADSFGKMLSKGIGGITQMVAGYVSLQAAVQLVTSAIQEQHAAQKDTLNAQVGQAAADATLIQNLVGVSAQQKKDTIATLENLTVDLGIESATAVKAGFNEAISKAAGDVDLAMDATRRAAELQRATPENLPTFAAGGASLATLIGTRDTREAYGLLSEIQARSKTSQPKELMAELPGALSAMTAMDARGAGRDSVREAGALMAAMTHVGQAAAPTSTAAIQLTMQLEKFFKAGTADLDAKIAKLQDRAGKIAIGGVKGPHEEAAMQDVKQQLREVRAQKAAVEVADPGTLAGRIEAIQNSQALQARILPTLTGEGKLLPAMKQLLRGDNSAITQQFRRNIGTGAEGGLQVGPQQFDILAKELGAQSEVSNSIRQQAIVGSREARKEAGQLEDDVGARLSQISQEYATAMEGSIRSWTERFDVWARQKTVDFGTTANPEQAAPLAAEQLAIRAERLRGYTATEGGETRVKRDDELSQDTLRRVQRLQTARDVILKLGKPTAVPDASELPGTVLSRRAANLKPRPDAAGDTAQRSPAGQRNAPAAPAAVDMSALQATNEQQLAKLDQLNGTMARMEQSFSRTAARMAGVAAKSELMAANA